MYKNFLTRVADLSHKEVIERAEAFPPFDYKYFSGQLFWLVISFSILYALLSRIALPRTQQTIEDRKKRLHTDFQALSDAQEALKSTEKSTIRCFDSAHDEALRLIRESSEIADSRLEETRAKIETTFNKNLQKSQKIVNKNLEKTLLDIEDVIDDLVPEILGRLSPHSAKTTSKGKE